MRAIFPSLSLWSVAVLAMAQPTSIAAEESLPAYDDEEAYHVYSAVLRRQVPGGASLLIEGRTVSGDNCIAPSGSHSDQVREANEDSRRTNQRQFRLSDRFEIPVKLLNDAEAREVQSKLAGAADPELRRVGITSLSAVGFSKDRTVAVLHVGSYCGLTCSESRSSAYIKRNGAWIELKGQTACMTVSSRGSALPRTIALHTETARQSN